MVASEGADPSQEREVEALLGPQDALMRVPGACDAALWNAGAARAGTPWLVFTEGHCRADPGCLEAVAQWVTTGPVEGAANFVVRHDGDSLLSRLSERWFGEIDAQWRAPGAWRRVHRAGFAIRAEVFEAVGGFEPRYGQFAPPFLSARLHARGVAIGDILDAAIVHEDSERMRSHHADSANHARGEFEARSRTDPVFFERYFGHAPLWANQLRCRPASARVMVRAVVAAAVASPGRLGTLAARLRSLASPAVVGVTPQMMLHRLAVAFDELAVGRLPLPAAWRWSRFLRAHARVVRLAQLDWVRRQDGSPPVRRAVGRWPVESLGPETIVGVHGLEQLGDRPFRWTEPVVLLRLAPPEGEHELHIETGRLRGCPLDAVVAVVVGGRVLPRALLAADEHGRLVIRLPSGWSAAARDGTVLVCSPLDAAQGRPPDPRPLGLPVLSIAVTPRHAGPRGAPAPA